MLGRKTSTSLARTGRNLVDRFRLFINPCVLGTGKRLFGDGTVPAGLKLVDSKVSGTGVIVATYEPAGELVTGTFAAEYLARSPDPSSGTR